MDAALFVVIMLAAVLVAVLLIGRAQRRPRPDNPVAPREDAAGGPSAADDPRDRPGGPSTELDAPHSSELHPGERQDPHIGAEDVGRPSGSTGNEPEGRGR